MLRPVDIKTNFQLNLMRREPQDGAPTDGGGRRLRPRRGCFGRGRCSGPAEAASCCLSVTVAGCVRDGLCDLPWLCPAAC